MYVYPPLMGRMPYSMHGFGAVHGYSLAGDTPGKLSDFTEAEQQLSMSIAKAIIGIEDASDPSKYTSIPSTIKQNLKVYSQMLWNDMGQENDGPALLSTDDQVYQLYVRLQAFHDEPWMDEDVWNETSESINFQTRGAIKDPEDLANKAYQFYEAFHSTYYDEPTPEKPAGTPTQKQTASGTKTTVTKSKVPPKTSNAPPKKAKRVSQTTMWVLGGLGAVVVGAVAWSVLKGKKRRNRWDDY